MKHFKNRLVTSIVVACLGLASTAGLARQAPTPAQNQSPAPAFKSEEYLLLGNATRGAGEPMVAVDPTDPKNIIAVAMGSVQRIIVDGKPAIGNSEYHRTANSTITWLAVSHDAGMTWDIRELPILSGKLTRCPDSFADVTKDGVFIAGCEPRETASDPDYWGMSALMVSQDKGKTWGSVVQMISDYQINRFAPGLKPVSGAFPNESPTRVASNSPWDRPYTTIDDSTGVIYGFAHGGSAMVTPTTRRSQAYITASTDGGRSFGTVYSWDSPEYPQSSRGISGTAGHGVVAVAYIASSVPAGESATCPCAVLGLSRDRGKTFSYHVLKNIMPIAAQPEARGAQPAAGGGRAGAGGRGGGGGNSGLTVISMDPAKAGRIAMLKSEGPRYSVSISEDFGQTWSPFVIAGTAPDATSFTKPAFEFSRDGVIGLMWRAIYADRSYDIWASISKDSGKTFSKSLKVSHARSPASDPHRNSGLFGDDIQDLSMDKENIHMVWGDSRAGFLGVWYGRVRFADFEF
jgi:hypothetical protein